MNKIIFCTCVLFSTCAAMATDLSVGRIVEIKGEGFISLAGKTKEIRKGDQLFANSEIVVEHVGQVTFTDNADHRFHLGNSSSASLGINSVELRTGDLWFQSLNKTENYQVKTVNALIDYQGGEAIVSYDATKGKTQLMVINGMMKLSNLRTPELNLGIAEGNFSFIDLGYEEGAPRDPTPVGAQTYKQLVSLFKGIAPLDKKSETIFNHEAPKREIASVHEKATTEALPIPKKEVVVHAKIVKKHSAVTSIVHIYGQKKFMSKNSNRMPASVAEIPEVVISKKSKNKTKAKAKETENLLQALKNL
jgi:hypothetical protein